MSSSPLIGTASAEIEGRHLLRPAPAGVAAPLLVGFHGYGESAGTHLEAMEKIPGVERWHLASIQALSRFYNTRTGEVVGCWMTSQDREAAIGANTRYVVASVEAIRARLECTPPLALLGFSQGTAMAYRAAALGLTGVDALVALAGDAPPELATAEWRSRPRVLIGQGSEDDWYGAEKLEGDLVTLRTAGLEVETCRFDDGHVWAGEFYEACGGFLARLRVSGSG